MEWIRRWSSTLWIGAVAIAVAIGLYRQPIDVEELARRIDVGTAATVVLLIVAGKLLTIALVWFTLRAGGEDRGWRFAWFTYSLADISKYIPGGIWGIAGRIALYRQAGIDLRKGFRLLLIETALLIGFSLGTGLAALAILGRPEDGAFDLAITGGVLVAFVAAVMVFLKGLPFVAQLATVLASVVAWAAFGLSFALIAASGLEETVAMAGRFNVGFAAGQLAVFAPSGIGVRELVVAWLGADQMPNAGRRLIELVAVHRVMWLIADFLVLLPALGWRGQTWHKAA